MIGVALFGASVMTSILQSKEPSDNKSTSKMVILNDNNNSLNVLYAQCAGNLTSGGCKHDVSMCCSSIEFGREYFVLVL